MVSAIIKPSYRNRKISCFNINIKKCTSIWSSYYNRPKDYVRSELFFIWNNLLLKSNLAHTLKCTPVAYSLTRHTRHLWTADRLPSFLLFSVFQLLWLLLSFGWHFTNEIKFYQISPLILKNVVFFLLVKQFHTQWKTVIE